MKNKLEKIGQNSFMDNFVKTDDILNDMCGIIESSQKAAYQAVNIALVQRNWFFSVKISIPLENTGVSSVFATSVWPFSLIFSLARRNEGNFFQAVPTTLSSSLAEVRLASLVAWA